MKIKWLVAAVAVTLVGCATTKVLTPVGGSRSDSIVRLAYDVGQFEKPVVDFESGRQTAKARCASWGYSDAEQFGGYTTQCHAHNAMGPALKQRSPTNFNAPERIRLSDRDAGRSKIGRQFRRRKNEVGNEIDFSRGRIIRMVKCIIRRNDYGSGDI
jgi:hypothetical protein